MDERLVPASDGGEKAFVRFTARDWALLCAALALAALWFEVMGISVLMEHQFRPSGLGTTLYVLALFAAVLFRLGRSANWNRSSIFLFSCCILMALNCCIYLSPWTALINCVLMLGAGAMAIFSLSGQLEAPAGEVRVIGRTIMLSARALFVNVGKPFRALYSLRGRGSGRAPYIAAGFVFVLPVLALVIVLLSQADAVFAGVLADAAEYFDSLSLSWLWRVLRTLVLGLILFSALYFLTHGPVREWAAPAEREYLPATPFITALALFDAVYAVFIVIQFAFLFGGRETAAMTGGYAEYARSGFFQLVAVSVINLGAVLIASLAVKPEGRGKNALRAGGAILLVFTGVILASALYRMCLYISIYGMSILRALTLWGIAFIAVLLCAAGVKLFRPRTKFWPVLLCVGLCGWLLLSYSNVDARVAEYNVQAYLSGEMEEIDTEYIAYELSPESLPALKKLAAHEPELPCGDGTVESAAQAMENRLLSSVNWRELTLTALRAALS